MDRRNAIRNLIRISSAASVTSLVLINQKCSSIQEDRSFLGKDSHQIITELTDLIIPGSEIPGAKAANTGDFIVMMLKECYSGDFQQVVKQGITHLKDVSELKLGKSFLEITRNEQENLLSEMLKEGIANDEFIESFKIIKELTLLGYFTSEIGVNQALDYVPIPGSYDGCIHMKSNQRAWAI